mgnify:CR=1 FL=1
MKPVAKRTISAPPRMRLLPSPPVGYPHDRTRCDPCPRKAVQPGNAALAAVRSKDS